MGHGRLPVDRFVLKNRPEVRQGVMRPRNASEPRLIADAMLGRLARWLRILGYDTLYDPRWPDNELVRLARAQGRILLTRDVELAHRRGVRTLFVVDDRVEEQLRQVAASLGLPVEGRFSRCPVCNEPLEAVPKSWAWGYVPPYTFCTQREFRLCPRCDRFYWRGTHWQRMQRAIEDLEDAGERSRGRVKDRS